MFPPVFVHESCPTSAINPTDFLHPYYPGGEEFVTILNAAHHSQWSQCHKDWARMDLSFCAMSQKTLRKDVIDERKISLISHECLKTFLVTLKSHYSIYDRHRAPMSNRCSSVLVSLMPSFVDNTVLREHLDHSFHSIC